MNDLVQLSTQEKVRNEMIHNLITQLNLFCKISMLRSTSYYQSWASNDQGSEIKGPKLAESR